MERIDSSASIVGTWRLLSYCMRDASGCASYPFGSRVAGYALFTAEGYASIQLMGARRSPAVSEDRAAAGLGELVAAAKTYCGYCGRYRIDEQQRILTLAIEASFFPNWTGTQQERYFELEDDRLFLSAPPRPFEGRLQVSHLSWQRAALVSSGDTAHHNQQYRQHPW